MSELTMAQDEARGWMLIAKNYEEQLSTAEARVKELEALMRPREYPQPCGLCPGLIESPADLDWHGLGNCVPICERCGGSGEDPKTTPELAKARVKELETELRLEHRLRLDRMAKALDEDQSEPSKGTPIPQATISEGVLLAKARADAFEEATKYFERFCQDTFGKNFVLAELRSLAAKTVPECKCMYNHGDAPECPIHPYGYFPNGPADALPLQSVKTIPAPEPCHISLTSPPDALVIDLSKCGDPDRWETAPPCIHCGPICYKGAAHNARAEDGVIYEETEPDTGKAYANFITREHAPERPKGE